MSLPPDLRPLMNGLAQQNGLPLNAVADIEAAILSSPELQQRMGEAVHGNALTGLSISPKGQNNGGHFDDATGVVNINVTSFSGVPGSKERLDRLVGALGHEVEHAFQIQERRESNHRLGYDIEQAIRQAGDGPADLTPAFRQYLQAMRKQEAQAEIGSWNAVASRIEYESNGVVRMDNLLARTEATTNCTVKDRNGDPQPAPGITLSSNGQISLRPTTHGDPVPDTPGPWRADHYVSPNLEAVAVCHFDRPGVSGRLGQDGNANYTNYYGAHAINQLADIAQRRHQLPELRLDMAKLGLNKPVLESAGLDLGGDGRRLNLYDREQGLVTLKHSQRSDQHSRSVPEEQVAESRQSPGARIDQSEHPGHAMYQQAREQVHGLYREFGKEPDGHADQMSAALTAQARGKGLMSIDSVLLSDDKERIFAVQGEIRDVTARYAYLQVTEAMVQPLEQSTAKFEQGHAQQQELAQQQEQQQAISRGGMSR